MPREASARRWRASLPGVAPVHVLAVRKMPASGTPEELLDYEGISRKAIMAKSEGGLMRPQGLKTRIFLDGGDPDQTKEIIDILGFLDGQTTNPTLIGKNPEARKQLQGGQEIQRTRATCLL